MSILKRSYHQSLVGSIEVSSLTPLYYNGEINLGLKNCFLGRGLNPQLELKIRPCIHPKTNITVKLA